MIFIRKDDGKREGTVVILTALMLIASCHMACDRHRLIGAHQLQAADAAAQQNERRPEQCNHQ